ncbi:hypothetical protein T484DRAFT_1771342 [Baffinella frigidus]|nr:hypothetical protein T484DRAFT_1771342 [Cryptophyta sp. CCMP2293]
MCCGLGGEGALRAWSEATSIELATELENAAEAPAGRSIALTKAAVTPVRASVAASPLRWKNIAMCGERLNMSEQPQQFTIKIRNTDDVPLEFENPIHEQYLDKIKQVGMKAFKDWCNGIDGDFKVKKILIQSVDMFGPRVKKVLIQSVDMFGPRVKKILIQSVDMFGPRVGFIKFSADIQDKEGTKIPGVVFMRGNAVGIFVLITCEEDKKQYTCFSP